MSAEATSSPAPATRLSRNAWAVFLLLFASYAYFAQGGGWSQNTRLGQVRALAETGSFVSNAYLVYLRDPARPDSPQVRLQLPDPAPPPADPRQLATLDLSYFEGRYLPNKPPGASLLAVPSYWLASAFGAAFDLTPDDWWTLAVQAWITTAFSVGLVGALCGVCLLLLSRRLFPELPERAHLASALCFGLGTLVFPYATLLMDPVVGGTLALTAFALLAWPRETGPGPRSLLFAGLLCGAMVVVNYTSVLTTAVLGGYALWRVRPRLRIGWFVLGGVLPALFLAWYHQEFFGGVLETANSHQPEFMNVSDGSAFLGMIQLPDPTVAWKLLFSAYRGLFVACPVLMVSLVGLAAMARRRAVRAEAVVCIAIFVITLLLNASFNGWHAGAGIGPRYLVPAIPFAVLPLALCFGRLPFLTGALAALSAGLMLVATSVHPLVPHPVQNPWAEYMAPLARGDSLVLGREQVTGPVSVNPTGLAESGAHRLYPPDSASAAWNSFNVGEFLWPHSWLSVLPLLFVQLLGVVALLASFRRAGGRPGSWEHEAGEASRPTSKDPVPAG